MESVLWGQSSSGNLPDGGQWLRTVTDDGEKLGGHYRIFLFVRSGENQAGKARMELLIFDPSISVGFCFHAVLFFSPISFPFCFIQMYLVNVLILGCPLSFGKAFCTPLSAFNSAVCPSEVPGAEGRKPAHVFNYLPFLSSLPAVEFIFLVYIRNPGPGKLGLCRPHAALPEIQVLQTKHPLPCMSPTIALGVGKDLLVGVVCFKQL